MKKKKTRSKAKGSRKLVKREYTDDEKARIARYAERSRREPVKVKIKTDKSGMHKMDLVDRDETLYRMKSFEAFGTADEDLRQAMINQAVGVFEGCVSTEGPTDECLEASGNVAFALLQGIHPRDELEGMLALQMMGVHNLTMACLRDALMRGQTFAGKEANVNYATKLARTFIAQMEALKKYRSSGQQKIVVEHVNVNEGGQAIVGVVEQGGGGGGERKCG